MNKAARHKPLVIIQTYEDRNSGKEPIVQQTISERLSSMNQRETVQEKPLTPGSRKGSNASVLSQLSPPPPPPLPIEEDNEADDKSPTQSKQKSKAPPPPVPQKFNSFNQPPPCPTPDYDTLSISSTATLPKKSQVNGFAKKELGHSLSLNGNATNGDSESLESYKSNMLNDKSKSCNTYMRPKSGNFSKSNEMQNGSSSTLTKARPVSVVIGEYPSGTSRKQPKKLDFLNNQNNSNNNNNNSNRENGCNKVSNNQSIVSQFASELAQTLNRSNLRKKTESMENLLNLSQIKANSNGSVRISVNSNLLNRHLAKSTNDLSSLDGFGNSNRVTINISPNEKRSSFEATPSGILKHNTASPSGNHNTLSSSHTRSVLHHQKSITFGEM